MLLSCAGSNNNFTLVPQRDAMDAMNPPYIVLVNQYYVRQTQPQLGPPILVLNGAAARTPRECAKACTAEPGCDFASWHGADPTWVNQVTCWIKHIDREHRNCSVVAKADYSAGTYILLRKTADCALLSLCTATRRPF